MMTDFEDLIDNWRDDLDRLEDSCPWTGPRPFLPEIDAGKRPFIGRDDDVFDLVTQIRDNPLVILHGDSAVGKSSFIRMALSRSLERFNCMPIVCSTWPKLQQDTDPVDDIPVVDRYIGQLIAENFSEDVVPNPMPQDISDELRTGAAKSLAGWDVTPVLVLDQFEEFLRDATDSSTVNRLYRWIAYVNKAYASKIRIVLAFRSEYYARVRPLERIVNSHHFRVFELLPLTDDDAVREIIECKWGSSESSWPPPRVHIADTAVDLLLQSWRFKKDSPAAIFELQASLYAAYWQARGDLDSEPSVIDITSGIVASFGGGNELVSTVFRKTFETKLDHCRRSFIRATQSTDQGSISVPTDVFIDLVKDRIRSIVPHLSTESYKERRTLWDLLNLSHSREIAMLCDPLEGDPDTESGTVLARATFKQAEMLVNNMWSDHSRLLAVRAKDLLGDVGVSLEQPGEFGTLNAEFLIDCVPWVEDPADHSSGPVLGKQDGEVLVELVRSYLLAVLWLDASRICRVTGNGVALVHDQLGPALRAWEDNLGHDPYSDLVSITMVVGERMHWDMRPFDQRVSPKERGLLEPVTSPVFANARVQRCWIDRVVFRNIIFLGCDFRQTRFFDCVFDNVQFANCLLDGVLLDKCQIIGGPNRDLLKQVLDADAVHDVYKGHVPEFWAQDAPDVIRSLAYFRGKDVDISNYVLYSLTSGIPTIVIQRDQIPADAGQIIPLGGGLTIIGGRVSNLMASACEFFCDNAGHPGELAIAYTAGSSVDFVEQDELQLFILGSAIRGLSVSRAVDRIDTELRRPIVIDADESLLAGPWFSSGLRGNLNLKGSMIWGEANYSDGYPEFSRIPFVIGPNSDDDPRVKETRRRSLPRKTDFRLFAAKIELNRRIDDDADEARQAEQP